MSERARIGWQAAAGRGRHRAVSATAAGEIARVLAARWRARTSFTGRRPVAPRRPASTPRCGRRSIAPRSTGRGSTPGGATTGSSRPTTRSRTCCRSTRCCSPTRERAGRDRDAGAATSTRSRRRGDRAGRRPGLVRGPVRRVARGAGPARRRGDARPGPADPGRRAGRALLSVFPGSAVWDAPGMCAGVPAPDPRGAARGARHGPPAGRRGRDRGDRDHDGRVEGGSHGGGVGRRRPARAAGPVHRACRRRPGSSTRRRRRGSAG